MNLEELFSTLTNAVDLRVIERLMAEKMEKSEKRSPNSRKHSKKKDAAL